MVIERFPLRAGPKLWNEVPPSLKKAKSVDVFKSQVKTFLFKVARLDFLGLIPPQFEY